VHGANRGADRPPSLRGRHRDRDPQPPAGPTRRRPGRVHVPGGPGGVRARGPGVRLTAGGPHAPVHRGELWLRTRVLVGSLLSALAGIGVALVVSACQSSYAKNDELEKEGATILKAEKGVNVTETSSIVDVLNTTVLSDANGAAVV